jgi:uncharacterized protein (TIGR02600 family)
MEGYAWIFPKGLSVKLKKSSGMALVLVLASLAFLAALALAFLASVGAELQSSKRYADGVSAQILSQSAYNLAIAQIVEATQGTDGNGNTLAWASQPGMIRTYDTAGAKQDYYKLYSWDTMKGTGNFDPTLSSEAVSTTWYNAPALYTDLNQPLTISGTSRYPILDGSNLKTLAGLPAGAKSYDADSDNAADIDGFYIGSAAPVASTTGANPVPMPVKWLYVLEDGRIVAPSGGSGNTATFSGPNAPSAGNKIVGRVAFWADDETCKVNVNTASEGTYTDTPRVYSTGDLTLATNQPVRGEYQRYPGHPAMTSLSVVVKKPSATITDAQWAQELFKIVPRVEDGGSKAGTIVTTGAATPVSISPDADRLYASVEELEFKPARGTNHAVLSKTTLPRDKFFLTAFSRAPDLNLFNKPRVCIWPLHITDNDKFRTVFDQLIAFCSTMRNDLGTKSYRFYFQRQDSTSPTTDLPGTGSVTGLGRNRMLLDYLRNLTAQNIPGFGGKFSTKYGNDCNQILTEIFDYIRSTNLADSTLTDTKNGYTVNGSATNNVAGGGQVIPIEDTKTNTRGFGRFRTVQGASLLFIANVDGDDPLVPRNPTTHASMAPYPTSTSQVNSSGKPLPIYSGATVVTPEVAPGRMRIQAIFLPQFFDPSIGSLYDCPNFKYTISGLDAFQWNGGSGYVSMGLPATVTKTLAAKYPAADNSLFGDQLGLLQVANSSFVTASGSSSLGYLDIPKTNAIGFKGGDVTFTLLAPDGTTVVQKVVLKFPDGNFPVPSLAPNQVSNYYKSGSSTILDPWFPGPYNLRFFTSSGTYNSTAPDSPTASAGGRLATAGASGKNACAWILKEDVIRSVGVSSGDIRLVAAQKTTPAPGATGYPFDKVSSADWDGSTKMMGMHTFFTGNTEPYYGAKLGRLVAGASYDGYSSTGYTGNSLNYSATPTSSSLGGGPTAFTSASDIPFDGVAVGKSSSYASGDLPGDWDNAPLSNRDGPFINKADEGDRNTSPYTWKGRINNAPLNSALFTPNRQIPSAVTFGSLPTGVLANRPWQTLLFRPDPSGQHPGSQSPRDHLWLDLFHMPVVEPYAISEPLSTAGRINMNYQIVPFTYINRDTGIRAILKSEKVISIQDSQASKYKLTGSSGQANVRLGVDAAETLKGFQQRFASNDIFRSASEICDISLVPSGATYAQLSDSGIATNYWTTTINGHRLTGDNSRERPYATIYSRLTTKSNTFTIHARVQSLQKNASTDPAVWDESLDTVTGEYRGHQTIERYVDANDASLPDFADPLVTTPIATFYKTRVVASKQFAP